MPGANPGQPLKIGGKRMTNALLLLIADRDCPGHKHRIKGIEFKTGVWNNAEGRYVDGPGSYGEAVVECINKEAKA